MGAEAAAHGRHLVAVAVRWAPYIYIQQSWRRHGFLGQKDEHDKNRERQRLQERQPQYTAGSDIV